MMIEPYGLLLSILGVLFSHLQELLVTFTNLFPEPVQKFMTGRNVIIILFLALSIWLGVSSDNSFFQNEQSILVQQVEILERLNDLEQKGVTDNPDLCLLYYTLLAQLKGEEALQPTCPRQDAAPVVLQPTLSPTPIPPIIQTVVVTATPSPTLAPTIEPTASPTSTLQCEAER